MVLKTINKSEIALWKLISISLTAALNSHRLYILKESTDGCSKCTRDHFVKENTIFKNFISFCL